MLNDEVISALEPFFDWVGPTHDELTRVFERARVSRFDPAQYEDTVGKRRRVRTVLSRAVEADPEAGGDLVKQVVVLIRSKDGFVTGSQHYPGSRAVDRLRAALARSGYELTDDGDIRPSTLEGLRGQELSVALRSYVERVRRGRDDPALVVGTSKDMIEAAAKEVVAACSTERPKQQLPRLIEQCFDAMSLPTVRWEDFKSFRISLDATTEWGRLIQALQVLARCIGDLRNAEGTGHGRARQSSLTPLQGEISAEAAAVISTLLLRTLDARGDEASRRAG